METNVIDYREIKLIVSDMDGTLLDPQGNLNNTFFDLYKHLKDKNILFVAASGRQYFNLQKIFQTIKDEIIFIAENGTYVCYQSAELLVDSIPNNAIKDMIQCIRHINKAYPVLCGKKQAYIENIEVPEFEKEVRRYYERCQIVSDLTQIKDDEFLKIAVYDFENTLYNSYPKLVHFNDKYKVVTSGVDWVDIGSQHSNKGIALKFIQEKFNITPAQTIVFGDQMNDLEMMHRSPNCFAMKNAIDEIKAVARFEAPSNADNGVINTLNNIFR